MKAAGHIVGSGEEGPIRCRQKWVNLQSGDFKYEAHQNSTCPEYIDPPEYFSEIH